MKEAFGESLQLEFATFAEVKTAFCRVESEE